MSKPLLFIGFGQHAEVLYEIATLRQRTIVGYTDVEKRSTLLSYLGTDDVIQKYSPDEVSLVLALGTVEATKRRGELFSEWKRKGYHFETLVHPSAIVSSTVQLGEGTQVMAGAVLQPHVAVGQNVIINTNATVDHHTILAHHVHIAPGSTICGNVHIQQGVHIGAGATVIQSQKIAPFTTVGAGAVVVNDIGPNQTVVGIPAKER